MSTLPGREDTAVLVIAAQNETLADCHDARGTIGCIGELVERAHDAGRLVVWTQDQEGLEPGTIGWELAEPLAPAAGDLVVHTQHRDPFCGSVLGRELAARGIGRLAVAGARTDTGVRATCSRAAGLGYDIVLVEDAHTCADLFLPSGRVTAADLIATEHLYWSTLRYPGQTFGVERARWVRG